MVMRFDGIEFSEVEEVLKYKKMRNYYLGEKPKWEVSEETKKKQSENMKKSWKRLKKTVKRRRKRKQLITSNQVLKLLKVRPMVLRELRLRLGLPKQYAHRASNILSKLKKGGLVENSKGVWQWRKTKEILSTPQQQVVVKRRKKRILKRWTTSEIIKVRDALIMNGNNWRTITKLGRALDRSPQSVWHCINKHKKQWVII